MRNFSEVNKKREYHSSADDELTSEEELTSMAAEVESSLEQRCSPRITNHGSVPIVTTELSAALDRANVSNHTATFILAETARSLGYGISSFTVNPESSEKQD